MRFYPFGFRAPRWRLPSCAPQSEQGFLQEDSVLKGNANQDLDDDPEKAFWGKSRPKRRVNSISSEDREWRSRREDLPHCGGRVSSVRLKMDGGDGLGMGLVSALVMLGYVIVVILLLWFLGLGRSLTEVRLRSLRVQGAAIVVIVLFGLLMATFLALQPSIP